MEKKGQAIFSLILPAIGAGLIYVGYNDYFSVRADNAYANNSPLLMIIFMIIGAAFLAIGIIVFIYLFSSKSKKK